MGISQSDFLAMQARLAPKRRPDELTPAYEGLEKDLHQQILEYCASKGWMAIHSRMDRKATTAVGTPDFLILWDRPKALVVEAKRKWSKATPQQQANIAWARKLGYITGVVYSFDEFLNLIA